ncbi:MAG TPA: adenosylmethionine--8-amino-7-oxononanoate transaminase [Candidatus Avidesulfovibrio excrementigallinarum]|nr:adenosylmethionine--8-amino-7-oxononanoate transaminase [Candidatus Avidesulfovibrio excrementigallinarum]
MSARMLFVTGTDTDAGKTTVTAALLRALDGLGVCCEVLKPVQTGCEPDACGVLQAPDADRCADALGDGPGCRRTRALRCFRPACSPHLAAADAGESLDAGALAEACRQAATAGITLIEGAGGIYVPLNERETMRDLMCHLHAPVLLVVGNKLGCINHALLSLETLLSAGLHVAGMVLCRTTALPGDAVELRLLEDNAAMLARLGAARGVPLLAELPFEPLLASPDAAVRQQGWQALARRLEPAARTLCGQSAAPEEAPAHAARQNAPTAAEPDDAGDLLAFDRDHLWHPYTSATAPLPVVEVTAAQGTRLRLRDGRELVDGMSSWWCAVHGYGNPQLVRAIQEQAATLSHVMFGGITHRPAVELGRRLLRLLPAGLTRIFFADSGSVAVEVALKMAIQYQRSRGLDARTGLVALRGAYHGDTLGAMSVCDPVTGMHRLFAGVLPQQTFVERPSCRFDRPFDPASLEPMAQVLARDHKRLAAVIVEPVVQGAGGMWFYHPEYLKGVRRLCDQFDVLLIADEIATGFGRTGKMFASEWAGVTPDILCCGKALTGGMLTLSAVAATEAVATTIGHASPERGGGTLMHGPTFMGNPLACATACASLDVLCASPWRQRVAHIEAVLREVLAPCQSLPCVRDVRVLGAIGVVEVDSWVNVASMQEYFLSQGVWIRPFGYTVYLMPPFIASDDDLHRLGQAVFGALREGRHR